MHPSKINLNDDGAFLFREPTKLEFQIDRELLVVLHVPHLKATGIVVFQNDTNPKEVKWQLDCLTAQILEHLNSKDIRQVQVKMFGLRNHATPILKELRDWMHKHQLPIACSDIGRGVCRSIQIICGTGKVGVSYAEQFSATTQLAWDSRRNRKIG